MNTRLAVKDMITIVNKGKFTDCVYLIVMCVDTPSIYRLNAPEGSGYTLSPSDLRLMFNVDAAVDNDGYLNTEPLYVALISIKGLPLDIPPAIELWDINGLVYSSHHGQTPSACSWDEENSTALYHVNKFILGDYCFTCHFGGKLALTKRPATMLFKYQNTTGKRHCSLHPSRVYSLSVFLSIP